MKLPSLKQPSSQLTVLSTVYHRHPGESPSMYESKVSKPLASNEQPYTRKLQIDEEWRSLDTGWISVASLLLVANDEGKNLQTNPTEREVNDLACRVIQLGYSPDNYWGIPPGEVFQGCPSNLKGLLVRCAKGAAKVTIHIFPG